MKQRDLAGRNIGIYGGGIFFGVNAIGQPYFSLFAESMGASTSAIGLMVTLRALVPLFIAMPIGQMIDSIGALRMVKAGIVFLIASLAMTAFASELSVLALSQLVLGVAIMIIASSLQVLATEGEEDKTRRNRNINRYSMWTSAGSMAGPLVGGAVIGATAGGYRFAFGLSLCISVCSFLAVLLGSRRKAARTKPNMEPRAGAETTDDLRGTLRSAAGLFRFRAMTESYMSGAHLLRFPSVQFGLIGTFLIMFIQTMFVSFVPLYLHQQGYGAWIISCIVSTFGLAGLVARVTLGWLMRRSTLEIILIAAGLAAAASLVFIPIASLHAAGMIVLTLITGSMVGINLPVTIMIMVDDALEKDRGKVVGLRLLSNRMSQITSPAVFGLLGQWLGLSLAFYAGGGALFAAMLGFALIHAKRRLRSKAAGRQDEVGL